MLPTRWLVALGLGAFVLGLLVHLPARLVLEPLAERLPGLALRAASGTVLAGSAELATAPEGARLDWNFRPRDLLLLSVGVDWQWQQGQSRASGTLSRSPLGLRLRVDEGDLAPPQLNRVLARWQARTGTPLAVRNLDVALGAGGVIRRAEGRAQWAGGRVTVGARQPVDLPALRGVLSSQGAIAELVVDGETAPGEPLATVTVDSVSGELHARVFQRGATLLGKAAATGRAPDTVVFELRQPLR